MLDLERVKGGEKTHFFFQGRNASFHFGEFFFGSIVENGDRVDEISLLFFGSLVYLKEIRRLYIDRITV